MDAALFIGLLVAVGYIAYRSGKRTGSRLGYHVGRRRARRQRSRGR